ncbi:MAG TPA: hypothetical protein VEX41_00275, partial [Candidatus Eisenbacteria bacterium]|nr:hypothetical protein [Candidatus Eisenbacteria bacterium]
VEVAPRSAPSRSRILALVDLTGIAAGVLRMPVLGYLAAAAGGKMIKNILIAGGASTIGDLLARIPGG